MDLFLGLNGHTNNESLPLRFGIQITEQYQQFVQLIDEIYDQDGTQRQRPKEVESGNRHYIGKLVIPNADKSQSNYFAECRVVVGIPHNSTQKPPIVTILRKEFSPGDITVTKHISGMLKRGKITVSDIVKYLHPAYTEGRITNSNDVEEVFSNEILPSRDKTVITTSRSDTSILKSSDDIRKVIESFDVEDTELKAKPTFVTLPMSHEVKYEYSMADAYIENAWSADDKIWVDVIGSDGATKRLHSFKVRDHLVEHHSVTLDYLKSRIGQRAHFAVCMSDPCKGFLAESVTSISLQLMKF
jgi:hypothetical protein